MKYHMLVDFIEAAVKYVPRSCNWPAHELAALGVGIASKDHVLWRASYPTVVTRLVTGDSTVS
jgi:hypothetical protein